MAAASPSFWLAVAIVVVSGFGNGAAVVCNAVLVQRAVPDRLRGRAFTLVMSIGYACFGLGMIVAGPLRTHSAPAPPGASRRGSARSPQPSPPRFSAPPEALRRRRRGAADGPRLDARGLVAGVRAGDKRALARAITLVESRAPEAAG